MILQQYRDAIRANFAMLDSLPPSKKQLRALEAEGFTAQDVVDYFRWSEEVTGQVDNPDNRERMARVHQRVLLRQEAVYDSTFAGQKDLQHERRLRARKHVAVNHS